MLMKTRGLTGRLLVAVIGIGSACLTPQNCFGQVAVVRQGSFEIGGFAGASYGVDAFRVMGGGNVTYAVNKWLLPFAEYSYFPGIARTISQPVPGLSGVTAHSTSSTPLSDFNGGVHIRIPIRESRIVPYLVLGLGSLTHFPHTTTLSYAGADGLPHNIVGTDPAGTNFAGNFGGGLRYYVNQRFGFRLEAKGYKPADSSITPAFGKVEAGFFYQLR
jgi:hypothetical protein